MGLGSRLRRGRGRRAVRRPTAAAAPRRRRWPVPERIRATKVGFWYVVCAVLVGIAATNTGNNALYIVLAVMLALLVVSGVTSRRNLYRLACELTPPEEVFARRPFHLKLSLRNRGRLLPRWLLVFSVSEQGQPLLVPYLPRGGASKGYMELMLSRRGRHRFSWVHVGSIFPVGFFHKGMRYAVDTEVLVYPELYPAATVSPVESGRQGEGHQRRVGWGHELHSLRRFQPGDDPRRIHWKQTARTGKLVYTVRESEEGRRLTILFDNAVGNLDDPADQARFERLVSEAATAAVDFLEQGYEVELLTRESHLPYAAGLRQRRAILETLALVQPRPHEEEPLRPGRPGLHIRLGLERAQESVA